MSRKVLLACLMIASATAVTAPAAAQSYEDQQRWEAAQARYRAETDRYQMERDRYLTARDAYRRGFQDGAYAPPPGGPPPPPYADDGNYDAARYYRDGPTYRERVLTADDRVYRGSDDRYYCRRSDGTTGLIVGGATGGILGNVIASRHSKTVGTLLGGALGAIAGKSIDQNSGEIHCR